MHWSLIGFSLAEVGSTGLSILGAAAGLGLVIFVHELGHFLVAKACGVKCEKFYLGFDVNGWKILHFKWGETEYGIGAIPLGGYVKMLGQDDDPRKAAEERERSLKRSEAASLAPGESPKGPTPPPHHSAQQGDLPREPMDEPHAPYDPRSYMAKSVPQRMAIISAGVIMNLIFAVVFATIAYRLGVRYTPTIIGGVSAGDPAWVAGIRPGDQIIQINDDGGGPDDRLRFGQDLMMRIMFTGLKGEVHLTIRRYETGKIERITLRPTESRTGDEKRAVIGAGFPASLTLAPKDPAMPGTPAAQAGFEANDKIAAAVVDGKEVPLVMKGPDGELPDETAFQNVLAANYDRPVELIVERNASGDAPVDSAEAKANAKRVNVTLKPQSLYELGVVMELGPIVAVQDGSPAEKAGFKVGDQIVAINGEKDLDPMAIAEMLRRQAGQEVKVEVARGKKENSTTETLTVTPGKPRYLDFVSPDHPACSQETGLAYRVLNTVRAISPDADSEAKKLHPGDRIVSVELQPADAKQKQQYEDLGIRKNVKLPMETDNAERYNWPLIHAQLQGLGIPPGATAHIIFNRAGQECFVDVPSRVIADQFSLTDRGLRLTGLTEMRPPAPWGEAFSLGLRETRDSIWQVTTTLRKVFSGDVAVTNFGGLGTIAVVATASASEGISTLLLFLTLLSGNLAVLNILPIPVLDGGHLVLLIYEGIRGKPANERVVTTVTYAGLIFILTLMVFVLGLDITRFFHWMFK